MTLIENVRDIQAALRSGRFRNEAAVTQGVVMRLLGCLGWPVFDTTIVWPEYSYQGGRADLALCHPAERPVLLVEVKQVGLADGAERQLFEYAFHRGVPLVLLTDGMTWSFFLPSGQGEYGERRVYKLDLLERDPEESVARLERYLSHQAVVSGAALRDARHDYDDVARRREVRSALPGAWRRMMEQADESLVQLLVEEVESVSGFRPDLDTVSEFLRAQVRAAPNQGTPPRVVPARDTSTPPALPRPRQPPAPEPNATGRGPGLWIEGEFLQVEGARHLLIRALQALYQRDPDFYQKFADLPKHGKRRRYLSRERADLYPGRADLVEGYSHEISPGWWLGVNVGRRAVESIIESACAVTPLAYGRQLRIEWGDASALAGT